MTKDVIEYCKHCDVCQRVNNKFSRQQPELHPIPVTDVWKQIGIDLIGPLPETPRGHKYIITATDYFTKWPEAAPLLDKTAVGVANFLFSTFCCHGWPEIIISDQGREFVNSLTHSLYERTCIEHRISSPYHPQTNGLDERTNQTLVGTLLKLSSSKDEWDLHIQPALYAHRISQQDPSRFSRFYLMYNRHPRKAIDHEIATACPREPGVSTLQDIDRMVEKLVELRSHYQEQAQGNILKAQERQKTHYDAKHNSHQVRFNK